MNQIQIPVNLNFYQTNLRENGLVKVTELIPTETINSVRDDALQLSKSFGERKDLNLHTTANTPRKMVGVKTDDIRENGKIIPNLYLDDTLRKMMESIAGEKIYDCSEKDEDYLIFHQQKKGDTHGWHWGDFRYALIWVLIAPPIEYGGMLQCVPHTSWDKQSPDINKILCRRKISSYYFQSGDVYFFKTDTTLHRTVPLIIDSERLILNMTFACYEERKTEITSGDRWWN